MSQKWRVSAKVSGLVTVEVETDGEKPNRFNIQSAVDDLCDGLEVEDWTEDRIGGSLDEQPDSANRPAARDPVEPPPWSGERDAGAVEQLEGAVKEAGLTMRLHGEPVAAGELRGKALESALDRMKAETTPEPLPAGELVKGGTCPAAAGKHHVEDGRVYKKSLGQCPHEAATPDIDVSRFVAVHVCDLCRGLFVPDEYHGKPVPGSDDALPEEDGT